MNIDIPFKSWPKIPRTDKTLVTVTEKIDGTNGVIYIGEDGQVIAGSRNRWLHPAYADNFGFAAWVQDNAKDLAQLGPGYHYGEWWGLGIQRGYDLKEKKFSLFSPWRYQKNPLPGCCGLVPTLSMRTIDTVDIASCVSDLLTRGSLAAPGYMRPEGLIISIGPQNIKYIIDKDKE